MNNIDYLIYYNDKILTGNTISDFRDFNATYARCTGLTDKDGDKIYEYHRVCCPYQPRESVIIYDVSNARFVLENDGNVYPLNDYIAKDLKIIGYDIKNY